MALFEFELKPLGDVVPWGEAPDLNLHWFGLTDGVYYMNVGGEQLFRASPKIMSHWKAKCPELDEDQVYVDYQVARLYEDVWEILPNVLQSVPEEMNRWVATQQGQEKWETVLRSAFDAAEDEDVARLYCAATEWWNHYRRLATMHLKSGPNIWMWRVEETIHIRWNNESLVEDGIQPWTATRGDMEMSVNQFMREVELFHHRLMSQMGERIDALKTNNPIPHVRIDIEALENEQKERIKSWDAVLKMKPGVDDWSQVVGAHKKLRGGKNPSADVADFRR